MSLSLMAAVTICSDFGTKKIKSLTVSIVSPSICHEVETMEAVTDFIFLVPKSLQMVTAAMKLNDACSLEEKL